jgi:hypothetical protein
MCREKKLIQGLTAHDRNFDINVERATLECFFLFNVGRATFAFITTENSVPTSEKVDYLHTKTNT